MFRTLLLLWTALGVSDPCNCACLKPAEPDRPRDYIDLSHWLNMDTPVAPGQERLNMTILDLQLGTTTGQTEIVVMSTHLGTHLDAPAHVNKDQWTLDQIPADELYGPCFVISVEKQAKLHHNYVVKPSDLHYFEFLHGKIPTGSIVFFNTGSSKKVNSRVHTDLWRKTSDNKEHYSVGLSKEVAEFLVHDREVLGLGTDSFSYGADDGYEVKAVLSSENRWGLRNLANLNLLPPTGCEVYVLPVKLSGAGGSPARVIAFCEQSCSKTNENN